MYVLRITTIYSVKNRLASCPYSDCTGKQWFWSPDPKSMERAYKCITIYQFFDSEAEKKKAIQVTRPRRTPVATCGISASAYKLTAIDLAS